MLVSIDWQACTGSGACVAAAPSAFALVPCGEGLRAILVAPPEDDDRLLAAAHACPTLAISLADDDGTARYPLARG